MQSLRGGGLQELFDLAKAPVRYHVDTSDRLANHRPEDRRHPPKEPQASGAKQVFVVTAEQLIASISRETDGHRLTSQLGDENRRNLRGVGDPGQVGRRQLVTAVIEGIRRRDIAETEEEREANPIERAGEVRERVEGLELGAEQKRIVRPSIVEGLDAHAIANERERVVL